MKKILLLLTMSALLASCSNNKNSAGKYQATQLSETSFLIMNTETGEGEIFYKRGRSFIKDTDIHRRK